MHNILTMKEKKKKKFLNLPKYPGGNEAFREFIYSNLKYPEEAMKAQVQGVVYVSFTVADTGEVISASVEKGIGYGCDEEALRLVRMLQYEKTKNRGLRVTSNIRTRIEFRLRPAAADLSYSYQLKPKENKKDQPKETPKKPDKESYSYTISF